MVGTATASRSSASTYTAARVEAVLDLFCGDLVAFIARELLTKERATGWLRDLSDVLQLEALERFQVKVIFPDGRNIGLDYQVSDDGRIKASDASGGFSTAFIPAGSSLSLVVRWRKGSPKVAQARRLLRERGWGPATMLEVSGHPERAYSEGGYGVYRRYAGSWK